MVFKLVKILFVEPEYYYTGLLDSSLRNSEKYKLTFDGWMFYKKPPSYFKTFDAVCSVQYLIPLTNLVIMKAKKTGVATYLFADGIIEWSNCFNHPIVRRVGRPLFGYVPHNFFCCPGLFESNMTNAKGVSYLPSKMRGEDRGMVKVLKSVLITTANTSYFDDRERAELIILLRKVISRAKCKVYLRIFDDNILNSISDFGLENLVSCDFEKACSNVDAVISTPSSVVLTAMQMRLPVAQLVYRDSPLLLQSGWQINGSVDVQTVLCSMLDRSESRMRFQESQLNDNYLTTSAENIFSDTLSMFKNEQQQTEFTDNDVKFDFDQLTKTLESPWNINLEFTLRKVLRVYRKIIKKLKR